MLATLFLLRALDRPSVPRWLAYAAGLAVLGYIDLVALSVVAGHIVGAVLRTWDDHDRRQLWFLPAVTAGLGACLGAEPRIWVVAAGRQRSPYRAVTPSQAAVLRPRYQLTLVKHERGLTLFLLVRASGTA